MEYKVQLFLILDKKAALHLGGITRTVIPRSQSTNLILPNPAAPTRLHTPSPHSTS